MTEYKKKEPELIHSASEIERLLAMIRHASQGWGKPQEGGIADAMFRIGNLTRAVWDLVPEDNLKV